MKKPISAILLFYIIFALHTVAAPVVAQTVPAKPVAIVVHGGAGTIKNLTEEDKTKYITKLHEALRTGHNILKNNGSSLDAVQAAVKILEDSPLFNAGKGAVYTHSEQHELDASIMDGKTLSAGAVAGVKTVKNPIELARAVMDKSKHVMLVGSGAQEFAKRVGVELVENSYFDTESRLQQLKKIKTKNTEFNFSALNNAAENNNDDEKKWGTVGAVALDQNGNLAAATSTGGMTNKQFGRVGDSPVIGAGTYANNQSCAVSATGHGEYFIRSVVAYDICALKLYKKMSLQQAAKTVIHKKLLELGGKGGVIALDVDGNIVAEFNTPGMYRGFIDKSGNIEAAIYR